MKNENKKPEVAPLRKIVEREPYRNRHAGYSSVTLECGHSVSLSRKSYHARTRCWVCFNEAIAVWKAEHTCSHGVTSPEECIRCERDMWKKRALDAEAWLALSKEAKAMSLAAKEGEE